MCISFMGPFGMDQADIRRLIGFERELMHSFCRMCGDSLSRQLFGQNTHVEQSTSGRIAEKLEVKRNQSNQFMI